MDPTCPACKQPTEPANCVIWYDACWHSECSGKITDTEAYEMAEAHQKAARRERFKAKQGAGQVFTPTNGFSACFVLPKPEGGAE